MSASVSSSTHPTKNQLEDADPALVDFPRGPRFWLVILALGCVTFMTAFEGSAVSPALPIITHDLQGSSFIWVGSAYMLASTACIPLSGGLAFIFGRMPTMLGCLALLIAGSAICGASTSMDMMIVGRVVQGMGGGGAASTAAIVISDLVPLRQRGIYNGYVGIAWALSTAIGPIVGGALAQADAWRWIFYLNIPFCVMAAALIAICLRVPNSPGTFGSKLKRMDWIGITLVMASSTAVVIALTWGGAEYAWSSAPVLAPLIVGLAGLALFLLYEARYAKHPLVPFALMSSRTGLSGYLQTMTFPIVSLAIIYYIPVYYQACKGTSPTRSGVYMLAMALVLPPTGIAVGISVKTTGKYRPQLWTAWAFLLAGAGSLISLGRESPTAHSVGLLVLSGIGSGILYTTTYFPVLAPLHASSHPLALAYFTFLRNFAQVWGITIGGAILQNGLKQHLPSDLLPQLAAKSPAVAYAAIPLIPFLPDSQRVQVQDAFAVSLQLAWKVVTGIAALGLLLSLPMKALPLHTQLTPEPVPARDRQDEKSARDNEPAME
jgi:MFS family permease